MGGTAAGFMIDCGTITDPNKCGKKGTLPERGGYPACKWTSGIASGTASVCEANVGDAKYDEWKVSKKKAAKAKREEEKAASKAQKAKEKQAAKDEEPANRVRAAEEALDACLKQYVVAAATRFDKTRLYKAADR